MRNRTWHIFILLFILTGCIEPYVPEIPEGAAESYVVNGHVTSVEGYQAVEISQTAALAEPHYLPVNGCQGFIEDGKGNTFDMYEYEPGKYHVWIDQAYLGPGNAYRLVLTMPSGEKIESDFDSMPQPATIDAIYYEREAKYDANRDMNLNGMQFYADIHSAGSAGGYYRFKAEETWEYHTPMLKEYYYDGTIHKVYPPENSMYHICWSTDDVAKIFTLTTKNLVSTDFVKFPLQYVDNTTNRLLVKYSTEISLYSLSQESYNFWEKIRINSEAKGQLYDTQPVTIEGNLHNRTNQDRKVIGFFDAASVVRKRVFLDAVTDMNIENGCPCGLEELGIGGWHNVEPWEYPVYFTYVNYQLYTLPLSCVDCRAVGGLPVKPSFWP
jgi:hypothetical protein